MQACALAAQNQYEIAGEIESIVVGGAAFVETDNPEIVTLEHFKCTDQIDDARDAEVFGCAGAGFDGCRAEGRGATLSEENAIDTCAIGDAKKGAKVLRIFNAVEGEEEARGRGAGKIGCEEIFEREKFLRVDERDDSLMGGRFGGEGKMLARFLADADAGLAALGNEAVEACVVALASDQDVIEAPTAGLESFLDRMQAVENFHKEIVDGVTIGVCLRKSALQRLKPIIILCVFGAPEAVSFQDPIYATISIQSGRCFAPAAAAFAGARQR